MTILIINLKIRFQNFQSIGKELLNDHKTTANQFYTS